MVDVEFWIIVTENGDYQIGLDADDLKTRYEESIDADGDRTVATRLVKVKLSVPTPVPVELSATVADEPASGELKVA